MEFFTRRPRCAAPRSRRAVPRFLQVTGCCLWVCAVALLTARSGWAAGPDWPQFLGPHRTGISPAKNLVDSWPAAGPRQLWSAKAAPGMSGLSVAQGKVFTLGQAAGSQRIQAFEVSGGALAWDTPLAPAYRNSMGDGPRATPTVDGQLAFAFTGDGVLAAVRTADGTVVWKQDLIRLIQGEVADYGMACSPLVVGPHVIVTAGAPGASVIALDKSTGKLAWKVGADAAGYSSPAAQTFGTRTALVAFTGSSALGIDPRSGKQLWRYPFKTDFGCNTATPLILAPTAAHPARVFLSAGENHGSVLLELADSDGEIAPREVWSSLGGGSVMRNEWQTSVLLNGKLYGFDNVGSAGPVTHLTCIDLATGKPHWQRKRFGKGNLIAADGKLWITTMDGALMLVRATPEKFELLGNAEVLGTTRQAPVIAGTTLFARDDAGKITAFAVGR